MVKEVKRGLSSIGQGKGRLDAGFGWQNGYGIRSIGASQIEDVRRYIAGQRSAAIGDYDEDGRVDLVVSQNGAATKLYHHIGAAPGLRVKLNARRVIPPDSFLVT
jgi:hypothetical protein